MFSPLKFGICDIYMLCKIHKILHKIIFYTKFILYVNSILYDHLITVETIMIMFLHKRNICFTLENVILFCY